MWPFGDAGDFDRVHGDMVATHDESEEFYGRLLEQAFRRFLLRFGRDWSHKYSLCGCSGLSDGDEYLRV